MPSGAVDAAYSNVSLHGYKEFAGNYAADNGGKPNTTCGEISTMAPLEEQFQQHSFHNCICIDQTRRRRRREGMIYKIYTVDFVGMHNT